MSNSHTVVHKPLLIMYEREDGKVITELWPSNTCSGHEAYGLLICDAVRHAARAFNVPEVAVWEWVDKERKKPTGNIDTPKVS